MISSVLTLFDNTLVGSAPLQGASAAVAHSSSARAQYTLPWMPDKLHTAYPLAPEVSRAMPCRAAPSRRPQVLDPHSVYSPAFMASFA